MSRGGPGRGQGRKKLPENEKVKTVDIRIHKNIKEHLQKCKGKTLSQKLENLIDENDRRQIMNILKCESCDYYVSSGNYAKGECSLYSKRLYDNISCEKMRSYNGLIETGDFNKNGGAPFVFPCRPEGIFYRPKINSKTELEQKEKI